MKKPECPARKSADEWLYGLEQRWLPSQKGFFTDGMQREDMTSHKAFIGRENLAKGFLLFIVLSTLQSCAFLYPLSSQLPFSPEQVATTVSMIQQQEVKVHAFVAAGRLTVKEGYGEQDSHFLIAAMKEPKRIKIEITHPWGQPMVHLLVDGKAFAALSFAERKAYVSKISQDALSKLFPVQVDPKIIWDVLRGYPSLRPCHHSASQKANEITLFDEGGREIQILEMGPDDVQPRLVSFPGLATGLAFAAFQVSDGITYAEEVKVIHPKGEWILRNEKMVFNPPISDAIFTLERPSGFETVDLDALEKGKRLF